MSDEDAGFNVEDGGSPPPDPAPEPATEPAADPAPAAEPPPDDDEAAVDAAVGSPEKRQGLIGQLRDQRDKIRTLKQKADALDQVQGWYTQNKPYVDFLQAHPDLLTRQQPAPQVVAPAPPEQDEQLVALARTLDLYTPEGQPDAKRAMTIRNLVKSEAQSIAQETVRPLAAQSVRQQAEANLREALNTTLPNGAKPDPTVLQQIWREGDPKLLATHQGAALAVLLSAGLTNLTQPVAGAQPAAPAQAPVVSEPSGRVQGSRAPVSDFEQRVMAVRGIPSVKWQEYTAKWKPGANGNALED